MSERPSNGDREVTRSFAGTPLVVLLSQMGLRLRPPLRVQRALETGPLCKGQLMRRVVGRVFVKESQRGIPDLIVNVIVTTCSW